MEKAKNKKLAQKLLSGNIVILDSETTGLDDRAEACEIAAINKHGNTLFSHLIKPTCSIPHEVTQIHGITPNMVEDAPCFGLVATKLEKIINFGGKLGIYNFSYDTRILKQSASAANVDFVVPDTGFCVMQMYAEFKGEWNDYYGNYKWAKLTEAAMETGYKGGGQAHRALEDCLMTLHVLKYIAAY